MRPALLLAALALVFVARAAEAAPTTVAVKLRSTAGSWQPIAPADLGRAVEGAVLEELSRPGQLQLARAAGPLEADLELRIEGRLLDEAQTYTVALTIGPSRAEDLPSLSATETVALDDATRAQLLSRVEGAARSAAKGLWAVLAPQLRRRSGQAGEGPPPGLDASAALPWQWGAVRVPRPSLASAADLDSKDHGKRRAALRELTSLALSEASPRNALERCALEHPDTDTRRGCLEALRPLSRRTPPTQRVVIEVFRRDPDSRLRDEAVEQMSYFTGAGRAQAIQAWMEAAALGKSCGPLEKLGDLPNLDLVIVKCLLARQQGEARPSEGQHFRCIELVEPLSYARRRAVLWPFVSETDKSSPRYLEGAGEREGSMGTPWARAVDALLEEAQTWDPQLEEVLWGRYQRTLSAHALDVLSGYAVPSPRMMERMLEVVQTAGSMRALRAVETMGRRDPRLAPAAREKLAELAATGNYPKGVRSEDLQATIDRLSGGER